MAEEKFDGPRQWTGIFTPEGAEREPLSGALDYHPRDGILLRISDWSEPEFPGRDAGRVFPALQGVIEGGRACTVVHAFETGVHGAHPQECRIVGNAILLDGRCQDPAKPGFRRLRFRSPALTAIFRPHGIKVRTDRRRKRVRVDAAPLKPLKAAWGPDRLVLSSILNVPSGQARDGSYGLSEGVFLEVRFAKAVSLDDARNLVAALEFLTGLGQGAFGGPPDLLLWTDPVAAPRKAKAAGRPRLPLRLLLSQSCYRDPAATVVTRPLFALAGLDPQPLAVVGRWLDLAPRVGRLMTLFRAAAEVPDVETRFLFLIQAVEGLHRALDNGPAVDQKEFDRVVALLKAALPKGLSKDVWQFFEPRIPQRNEPGLGARLRVYGDRATAVLPGALPSFGKDRRTIVSLRDEFSHSLVRSEERSLETHARTVLYFCELLQVLFEFNLLRHLGVSDDRLRHIFEGNRRFDELARNRTDLMAGPA